MSRKSITGTELERLYLQSIAAANLRDWSHLSSPPGQEFLNHVSDDFQFRPERLTQPMSWAEAVDFWETNFAHFPNLYINVTDVSSNVDQVEGKATVHVQSETIGGVVGGEETKYVYFGETRWRFSKQMEKWLCFEMSGIRGTVNHQGFV